MERLNEHTETLLFRQERVPVEYSASSQEHEWHANAQTSTHVVTNLMPHEVLERAEKILEEARYHQRQDVEYRVILQVVNKKNWVIM